jgi:uncharacterized membrane protein HdeD (DUF308 family)
MTDQAKQLVSKGLPWRTDVAWQVVAVEAVALVGLGAFMLIDTETAGDVVLQIIGVVFLVTSLVLGAGTLRESVARLGAFDAFRAGIGVAVGAIATVSWWSDYIENSAVRVILGWGLVIYSVLHLVGLVTIRGRGGLRLSVLAIVAMTMVLGLVLLTANDASSTSRINLFGSIFLLFGLLLGGLAYYLYSRANPRAATATG